MTAASAPLPLVIVADHAANHVPASLDGLGLDPALLDDHIAVDIGTAALADWLARDLAAPLVKAEVSRLVIDLHREPDHPGLIPAESDGIAIPGNSVVSAQERASRIARWHVPHHDRIAAAIEGVIAGGQSPVLLALHSFTPTLRTDPAAVRPWHIGLLYNDDAAPARRALNWLAGQPGLVAGDNQPYSGKALNYTMNRHGEGRGIPYLTVEVRQDLISDAAGIARWGALVAAMVRHVFA